MSRHAVTPYGRGAGSSRVRVYSWLDRIDLPVEVHAYLARHNADPVQLLRHPHRVVAAEQDLRQLRTTRAEWLFLHREASPLSRGRLEPALLTAADTGIYDFDDALHCDTGGGPPWRRLAPKSAKTLAAVRAADRVVAGNEILADWASDHARDVVVVPSCVAVDDYRPKQEYHLSDPPRLVWVGSRDNERVLSTVEGALEELHRRTALRLTLIGSTRPTLGPLERLIDRLEWSEDTQHHMLSTMDVGLMPLVDDPYSRGKCGYKLLQYAASGVPAVASPVGANATIVKALGLPEATTPQEWCDAVLAILESSDASRALMGQRSRTVVSQSYSYDAWLRRWLQSVGLSRATRVSGSPEVAP